MSKNSLPQKRKLKPIERCPDGHHYNAEKYGEICGVCGKRLDPLPVEEMTPEEIFELTHIEERDRVCGWLICIRGVNKGRDYRICEGRNCIGSASTMDIQIIGDKGIEKLNHAVIIHDKKGRSTKLLSGDSRGMVYIQGQAIYEPTDLEALSQIELGESVFVFMPLCGDKFNWEDFDGN